MTQAIAIASAAVVFSSRMDHQAATTDAIGYCKRCGQDFPSTQFKCVECRAPTYCQCRICGKELLLHSRSEHVKSCCEDKVQKQPPKSKIAETCKMRWKRSASNQDSPYASEDSGSESEHKKGKQHSSDEEYTASSASEDDCWSPESSPDSGNGKSAKRSSPSDSSNYVSRVSALYNYVAMRKDDLSFNEGDLIHVLNKRPSGWWLGELKGKVGLLPSNYVKELPMEPQKEKTNPVANGSNNRGSTNGTVTPKQGKNSTCKTIAEYEELMRLLKLELEQSQLRCRQQEDKIRLMEKERTDSVKELTYIKAVLESSLNYKQEEDDALEALNSLHSLL